jgi:hypothetical protein
MTLSSDSPARIPSATSAAMATLVTAASTGSLRRREHVPCRWGSGCLAGVRSRA